MMTLVDIAFGFAIGCYWPQIKTEVVKLRKKIKDSL